MPRRRPHSTRTKTRAPRIEALERRRLLSLSPTGAEFRINQLTTNDQGLPVAAVDGDGDFVVAWQSEDQDGSGYGIYARRYNFNGFFVGDEFRVNSYTTGSQSAPAIAIDGDGDFVVVWQSADQDGSGTGIYARRFDPMGAPRGLEFRVNSSTGENQSAPAVAMDIDGDFVISWMNGSSQIVAQRFSADGVARDGEFQVNTDTSNLKFFPAVAMDADGDFVVAWESYGQDGSYWGAYAQRFNAAGVPQGAEFRANNFTTNDQRAPSVAMDLSGDFVIAWQSFGQDGSNTGVYAKRYTAAGAGVLEFRVNVATASQQGQPSVSMDADGDFVIAYNAVANGSYDVVARTYNASGSPQGGEFTVNSFTGFTQLGPSVAMEPGGDMTVAWASDGQDGSSFGVYAQRYEESNEVTGPCVTEVAVEYFPITPGMRLTQNPLQLTLNFSEEVSTTGGAAGLHSAENVLNYSLTRNGVDVSSLIIAADYFLNTGVRKHQVWLTFSTPLTDGSYVLSAREAIHDPASNPLDGNFDGVPGGDFSRAFTIENPGPAGPEFRVNTFTTDSQRNAVVASDDAGNFVVAWSGSGNQDGSLTGIFAQRYDAAGQPLGAEFRVNTYTTQAQTFPAVAMSADGNFVIAWQSLGQDGFGYGIYAQRYSAAGTAQGAEIHVTAGSAPGQQVEPSIAMSDLGSFVVCWSTDELPTGGQMVFARRFDSTGATLGSSFFVSTLSLDDQNQPSVAMNAGGAFVVAWSRGPANAQLDDIRARLYTADGIPATSEFPVNSFSADDQFSPSAAMDAEGDFVIAWTSYPQDTPQPTPSDGVYAQRFSAAGAALGTEFRVNTTITGNQFAASAAMDRDGDFVITWNSRGQDDPASSFALGVYAQRYNSVGVPQGGEFKVNSFVVADQRTPAAAMDADGDFVVTWESLNQDGSTYGVYAQRYAAAPAVSASTSLYEQAPHRLQFAFNTDVSASLTVDDFVLENLTTLQTIPSAALSLAYDGGTNTATLTYTGSGGGISGILADGNYRATILAAGVAAPVGTFMQANHQFDFRFLNGDANGNGVANSDDFNILATNFGLSGKTFSQGNFNYDPAGLVNSDDFNILALNFGVSVAPRASVFAQQSIQPRDRLIDTLLSSDSDACLAAPLAGRGRVRTTTPTRPASWAAKHRRA